MISGILAVWVLSMCVGRSEAAFCSAIDHTVSYTTTCSSGSYTPGDECTFLCREGFSGGGTVWTCINPEWSGPEIPCTRTFCNKAPAAPENGVVTFTDGMNHLSRASFACNEGYRLSAFDSPTCDAPTSNQAWPSTSVTCIANVCFRTPSAPLYGIIDYTNVNYHGSRAVFGCQVGYTYSGVASVVCNAPTADADDWPALSPTPKCTALGCTDPPTNPPNGAVAFSAGNSVGSVATFSCSPGYMGSSPNTVSCETYDKWPSIPFQCTDANPCAGGGGCGGVTNAVCTDDGPNSRTCACAPGYGGTATMSGIPDAQDTFSGSCVDVNACSGVTCGSGGSCVDDDPPSTGYSCLCPPGYRDLEGACEDHNGCEDEGGRCAANGDTEARCVDVLPPSMSFSCLCSATFVLVTTTYGVCEECVTQDNCVELPSVQSCVERQPFLKCMTSADGYFVDGSGTVKPCSPGCTICSGDGACSACSDPNAVVVEGVCECVEGYFGTALYCSLLDACDGNACAAFGDTGATCVITTETTYQCACSPGYDENSSQQCIDFDACIANTCASAGDTTARCLDGAPPSTEYTCDCGPTYVDNAGTCEACPTGCATCLTDGTCLTCLPNRGDPGRGCGCSAGYYTSAGECTACSLGCVQCTGASACQSCGLGELVDGECVGAERPQGSVVVEEPAPNEASTGMGLILGIAAGGCCLLTVVILATVLILTRGRGKKHAKYMESSPDATVQLEKGKFNDFLKGEIRKTTPFATGGFGSVYKIKLESGVDCALKVLAPDASELARAEFHQECAILSRLTALDSPLVVAMLCFCDDPVCLGMEYAPGGTLDDRMKEGGLVGDALVCILKQAVAPVDFLHANGIAHLDIKPANYLIVNDDRVVICDFGLSVVVADGGKSMGASGTPQYLAPERYQSMMSDESANIDLYKCDMFSLGIVMAAMANGEMPFGKIPASNVPTMVSEQNMRPPVSEHVPMWLRTLMTNCWNGDPSSRPDAKRALSLLNSAGDDNATVMMSARSSFVGTMTSMQSA